MAVAFVDRTLGGYNNTSSWFLSVPAGVVDGDILLWRLTIDRTSVTATTPSGWTLEDGPRDQTGAARSYLFSRIASSEPANYTITLSGAAHGSAIMIAYTSVDATDPVEQVAGSVSASTATPQTSALTPGGDGYTLVGFFGCDSATTKLPIDPDTSPVATERGETEQNSGTRFYATYVEEYLQTTAASETLSLTTAGAEIWMMQLVSLAPATGLPAPTIRVVQSTLRW
jgi:hypothetical protein